MRRVPTKNSGAITLSGVALSRAVASQTVGSEINLPTLEIAAHKIKKARRFLMI
jgi:hypothetical protein